MSIFPFLIILDTPLIILGTVAAIYFSLKLRQQEDPIARKDIKNNIYLSLLPIIFMFVLLLAYGAIYFIKHI